MFLLVTSMRKCDRLTYYPSICEEELNKTTKKFSQVCGSPDQDLNPVRKEYKAEVLNTRPDRSVT
jgi:hypothetical protein